MIFCPDNMQEKIRNSHEDGLTHYSEQGGHRERTIFWENMSVRYYLQPETAHRDQKFINTRKMRRNPRSGKR